MSQNPYTNFAHGLNLDNAIGVAPGPASPATAGPLFAQETDFLKIKAGELAHFQTWGRGGGWL